MRRFTTICGAALLAGCGQPAPAPRNVATPREHGYHAKVDALSPRLREIVLFRAIRSGGGGTCQDVKQVVEQRPAANGDPVWLVTCDDGALWQVQLGDDGTALVTATRATG